MELKELILENNVLESTQVVGHLVWAGEGEHIVHNAAVDNISEHCSNNLPQQGNKPPSQPLIARLELKHLGHQQQHDAKWDVVICLWTPQQVLMT